MCEFDPIAKGINSVGCLYFNLQTNEVSIGISGCYEFYLVAERIYVLAVLVLDFELNLNILIHVASLVIRK